MPNWDDPTFLVPRDTKWQAQLRALQSWYRQTVLQSEAGLQAGATLRGNLLPSDAPHSLNFLTPEIAQFVEEWLPGAEKAGAFVKTDRLWRNLLSSMPLAFNLFVPLRNDLGLASGVLRQITRGRVYQVTGVEWEYSPGRRDPRYTNDRTAFDVFISFTTRQGGPGFIAVEVKYHEDLGEDNAEESSRYFEIADQMGCFFASRIRTLRYPPLGQIWRNHLLAGSLQMQGRFDDYMSVVLFPSVNISCGRAVQRYQDSLSDSHTFAGWHLESVVDAIGALAPSDWIRELRMRYLDLSSLAHGGRRITQPPSAA